MSCVSEQCTATSVGMNVTPVGTLVWLVLMIQPRSPPEILFNGNVPSVGRDAVEDTTTAGTVLWGVVDSHINYCH